MKTLSLNQAWNETAAFAKREARLLFPIALLLVALPMTAMRLLVPASAGRGELPDPGLWLLAFPVAIVIGMVGNLAIATLALRRGLSVGEALSHGLRRMPALLAATLLVGLAATAAAFLILVLFAILFGGGGTPTTADAARIAVLSMIVMLPLGLYVFSRLMLTTPIAADEAAGPLAIIRRSWQLTRGVVWKLILFILLVILLFLVISVAVTVVFGILLVAVAGRPDPGTVSALVMLAVDALLNTAIGVYMTVMIARIYAQLSGAPAGEAAA